MNHQVDSDLLEGGTEIANFLQELGLKVDRRRAFHLCATKQGPVWKARRQGDREQAHYPAAFGKAYQPDRRVMGHAHKPAPPALQRPADVPAR